MDTYQSEVIIDKNRQKTFWHLSQNRDKRNRLVYTAELEAKDTNKLVVHCGQIRGKK